MFDFDAGKMIVFGVVALAVIPPKDLPRVLRTVGKYVGQMRRMASDFQGQFMDALKEADLDNVRKEIAEINESSKLNVSFDPAGMMRDSMEKAVDAPASVHEPAPAEPPALAPPAAELELAPAVHPESEKTPASPT